MSSFKLIFLTILSIIVILFMGCSPNYYDEVENIGTIMNEVLVISYETIEWIDNNTINNTEHRIEILTAQFKVLGVMERLERLKAPTECEQAHYYLLEIASWQYKYLEAIFNYVETGDWDSKIVDYITGFEGATKRLRVELMWRCKR